MFNIGDIVSTNTRKGFFGYEYYDNLVREDKTLFPQNTKFPLTEEEAKKLMIQEKQKNLEEK
jgi:hypothetical protein